jgi:hypothetical protein
MYWIEKMATVCVILPQLRKKIYFSLVFRKLNLSHMVQFDRRFNMKKILASVFVLTLLGSGVHASGCSEMAAFNTKIKKALKTASFNEKTLADIRNLQSECKRQHDMGMSVSSISSCNKALDLVAVN